MVFASKEWAITSSSCFSGKLFSKDSAKEWFLFLSWDLASPTVHGRLLIPAENTGSSSSLTNKPPYLQTSFPEAGEKLLPGQPAGLRTTSHPMAGMLINFATNELVRTYLPHWRFEGRHSFDVQCHLPPWASRISPKPCALVLLCC